MENPWKEIRLTDYESHMALDTIGQLQAMNELMRDQLFRCPARTAMILGIAGGNGLEHIAPGDFERVYGVDVNPDYLAECVRRYPQLAASFRSVRAELPAELDRLPRVKLLIANLFVEYIGCEAFGRTVAHCGAEMVSCVIQRDTEEGFVSDSPYHHAFDRLEEVHRSVDEGELTRTLLEAGYRPALREERPLPNGKALVRLDYRRGEEC